VQLAETPSLFRYLSDCKGVYHVVEGDARLSLASAAPSAYDLFIVDAFNSDAIPVHLLTTQAMALYGQKLTQDGLLAFNISNRYLNLAPVLGNLAAARGWTAYVRSDENVSAAERSQGIAPSEWVVMSRSAAALAPIAANPEWERLEGQPGSPVWTDDYSNVLGALRLHW
jgi:spermidine synthase